MKERKPLKEWTPEDHHIYGERLKKRLDKIDRIFLYLQKGISILLWIMGGGNIIIGIYQWDSIWAIPSVVAWIGASLLWPSGRRQQY